MSRSQTESPGGAGGGARARLLAALLLATFCCASLPLASDAAGLPDGRVYELVTRYEEGGHEVGLNDVTPSFGVPAVKGEAFDWTGVGGCCQSTSADIELYQSSRGPHGWQTKAMTPTAREPSPVPREVKFGIAEGQVPMFTTADLGKTIFATPLSYAPGDHRPPRLGTSAEDLYLEGPLGELTWLSQGPSGTGSEGVTASFAGATPDANEVVFTSKERLTPDATGPEGDEYLYVRNVVAETTQLVDVDNSGAVMSARAASLGNGSNVGQGHIPANARGTTTNAISADGSKVFFETPPEESSYGLVPHLYMRNLSSKTTTALDDPNSSATAQYEGAAADGSLVFFTSNEGLGGAPAVTELYEYNTTSAQIGQAPPMSAVPISGGGVVGVSAISNDGSHVYFVADPALASNTNSLGRSAVAGRPNIYVYDTRSGATTFIATGAEGDVANGRSLGSLVREPDINRSAYPTPDGSVLLFESIGDLTGQDPAPESTLTAVLSQNGRTVTVASTAGFVGHDYIQIGKGETAQIAKVETIDSPTEMTLSEVQEGNIEEHQIGETVSEPSGQVYRYELSHNQLICLSCTPTQVPATGSASLGVTAGGSYAPPSIAAQMGSPMSEDGSRIFFESPDPLLPGVGSSAELTSQQRNLYEWEGGKLSLISDPAGGIAILNGTTPSGNDVFFTTRARLTAGETNGLFMVYDARVNGGFPSIAGSSPCSAEDCRTATSAGGFFSTPASATLGGPLQGGIASVAKPKLVVAKITSKQRVQLLRTGRIVLEATASDAGIIIGEVTARLQGRLRRVARASVTLSHGGTATLKLQLSGTARRALAKLGALSLRFQISYSADSGTLDVTELRLANNEHAPRGRRRHA